VLIALFTFLIVLSLSLLVMRIATIALVQTGLSEESARFQVRSAFLGVGFTTRESEHVANHPVRRRVVMALMLLGSAGVVTSISTLILAFNAVHGRGEGTLLFFLLPVGVTALWLLSRNRWVSHRLSILIAKGLRRYTDLDVRDYASLLRLTGEYRVTELNIDEGDWLAGKTLADCELRAEGLNVLGIRRLNGEYDGNPLGTTTIRAHDTLVLYGRLSATEGLDRRRHGRDGDLEHEQAVEAYEQQEAAKEEAEFGALLEEKRRQAVPPAETV
jgi:uncharacterized membrane protein